VTRIFLSEKTIKKGVEHDYFSSVGRNKAGIVWEEGIHEAANCDIPSLTNFFYFPTAIYEKTELRQNRVEEINETQMSTKG
jgi:hypothetical protein